MYAAGCYNASGIGLAVLFGTEIANLASGIHDRLNCVDPNKLKTNAASSTTFSSLGSRFASPAGQLFGAA